MVINIKNCHDKYFYGVYNLLKNIYVNAEIIRDGDKKADLTVSYEASDVFVTVRINEREYVEEIILENPLISIGRGIYKLSGANLKFGTLIGVRPARVGRKYPENTVEALKKNFFVDAQKAEIIKKCADFSENLSNSLKKGTVSLYINIPFCPTRCDYCSFTVSSVKNYSDISDAYFKALIYDLRETAQLIKELKLSVYSVYIGGGTPTILCESMLDTLLSEISRNFPEISEFCVEAGRVDTITEQKLKIMYDNKVNRISINPQTLNQKTLDKIGRKSSADEFFKAYENARKIGFEVINTDLIAGLFGESFLDFKYSLDGVLALEPQNITVHTLCKKRAADLENINENAETEKMLDYTYQKTEGVYEPYYIYRQKNAVSSLENIGLCKKNSFCAYNIFMMEEISSVISVGAGGVSKLIDFENKKAFSKLRCDKQPQYYIMNIENIIKTKREFLNDGYFKI